MVQAMAAAGAAQGLLKNRAVQVLLVGGGILTIWVLYKVVRSVMENLQIVDTAEERAAKAGSMNIETDNKLKPGYWKTLSENQQKKITDKAQFLTTIANDLYKAIHDYYGMEDEEAVLGAVKSVNSKAEWS
ncbi:MAG: hypothetical protein UT61_C0025G0008 [Candidatus Woesebacteria bacterium GW2011_GWA1_39_8]|uniref:Uncharacterized protein n=1 Tax=Candidatus Woesebacteria bacterium GW2011_GWA1_39_8 TaxID=1618552 RepID=A0A0G0PX39_9BACT|nr:MAG: hypothetical protein UT61_C0025G0008 [Candidatus Woesebacteria bacterium GW2011_GWA1_39_8]